MQGGSTLTQQLVRNLYISRERTLKRKIKEACLAIKLSRHWSKDKVLQEWLNQVYFGNHAYGVEAAAQTYFSKQARELTLSQAALLAGLPPTLLHGDVHPGNVLVHADQATLIDWGSSRIGPAALDLANLVTVGSADVARYARTWQQLTGQPLSGDAIEVGYRWAALQIPVQYLPWTIGHQPTRDVEAVLDQIERALGQLRSLAVRDRSCRDRG